MGYFSMGWINLFYIYINLCGEFFRFSDVFEVCGIRVWRVCDVIYKCC